MSPSLHDYQDVAVGHLERNDRAGLFLDMGLGKTACVLTALEERHLPVLVTATKRVTETVWTEERDLWRPDLSIAVAAGKPEQRHAALASGADIVALSRDNLVDAKAYRKRFRTVVIDELSGFKTPSTDRYLSARRLSVILRKPLVNGKRKLQIDLAPVNVWGLTGTPSPNGLLDLWSQMFLLDGGARLGTSFSGYRERYFLPGRQIANGTVVEWILKDGADKAIWRKIDDICLAMESAGRIDLPPMTLNKIFVALPPAARLAYKDMKKRLVADLTLIGGEVHSATSAAILSAKLSQIAAGFMYVDDADIRNGAYDIIHREKIRALSEIVDGTGSPVLVFYRFRAEAEMIRRELGSLVSTIDEDDVVGRWNAGKIPVLLAHPASAGHGLNLQKGPGHTIVWTSLPWSLEEWMQANKRLLRQGQANPVIVHLLLAERTIDPSILERLEEKESVQAALLNHLESVL